MELVTCCIKSMQYPVPATLSLWLPPVYWVVQPVQQLWGCFLFILLQSKIVFLTYLELHLIESFFGASSAIPMRDREGFNSELNLIVAYRENCILSMCWCTAWCIQSLQKFKEYLTSSEQLSINLTSTGFIKLAAYWYNELVGFVFLSAPEACGMCIIIYLTMTVC